MSNLKKGEKVTIDGIYTGTIVRVDTIKERVEVLFEGWSDAAPQWYPFSKVLPLFGPRTSRRSSVGRPEAPFRSAVTSPNDTRVTRSQNMGKSLSATPPPQALRPSAAKKRPAASPSDSSSSSSTSDAAESSESSSTSSESDRSPAKKLPAKSQLHVTRVARVSTPTTTDESSTDSESIVVTRRINSASGSHPKAGEKRVRSAMSQSDASITAKSNVPASSRLRKSSEVTTAAIPQQAEQVHFSQAKSPMDVSQEYAQKPEYTVKPDDIHPTATTQHVTTQTLAHGSSEGAAADEMPTDRALDFNLESVTVEKTSAAALRSEVITLHTPQTLPVNPSLGDADFITLVWSAWGVSDPIIRQRLLHCLLSAPHPTDCISASAIPCGPIGSHRYQRLEASYSSASFAYMLQRLRAMAQSGKQPLASLLTMTLIRAVIEKCDPAPLENVIQLLMLFITRPFPMEADCDMPDENIPTVHKPLFHEYVQCGAMLLDSLVLLLGHHTINTSPGGTVDSVKKLIEDAVAHWDALMSGEVTIKPHSKRQSAAQLEKLRSDVTSIKSQRPRVAASIMSGEHSLRSAALDKPFDIVPGLSPSTDAVNDALDYLLQHADQLQVDSLSKAWRPFAEKQLKETEQRLIHDALRLKDEGVESQLHLDWHAVLSALQGWAELYNKLTSVLLASGADEFATPVAAGVCAILRANVESK